MPPVNAPHRDNRHPFRESHPAALIRIDRRHQILPVGKDAGTVCIDLQVSDILPMFQFANQMAVGRQLAQGPVIAIRDAVVGALFDL